MEKFHICDFCETRKSKPQLIVPLLVQLSKLRKKEQVTNSQHTREKKCLHNVKREDFHLVLHHVKESTVGNTVAHRSVMD